MATSTFALRIAAVVLVSSAVALGQQPETPPPQATAPMPARDKYNIVREDRLMIAALQISAAAWLFASIGMASQVQPTAARWTMRATDHFDIYFQPTAGGRVDAIAREAERAYARISNLLRYDLADKMDVIVVALERDVPRTSMEAAALVRASGASTRDHLLLSLEAFEARGAATLAHELTHQFTFELLPDWQRAVWVAEALADHHAGAWEPAELTALHDAIARGQIPDVERLTAADRHWGHAVLEFVATEYGARGVRAYLTALRETPESMRDPIRIAFDVTPADFNAAFRGFVAARFGR